VPEADSHSAKENKSSFLKAIGAVAAVVSLLLALNQVTGLVQNLRIHHKEFADAMKSGEQEQARGDYGAAFRSFKHATELDPIDHHAQAKETQAAMLWLENVHGSEKQSFTDVANQLLPVFDSALVKAKGPWAGDVLAHVAWANFLKYRDGVREGVDVDGNLKAALVADPDNVYAHAMSGLWVLWESSDIKSAESHFNAALATGRAHDYVREMQLAALGNHDAIENDVEQFRVSNDMRKAGETMEASHRKDIFWKDFTSHLHDPPRLVAVLSALPTAEAEATYDWLDMTESGQSKTWNRTFVMANLKEITGDRAGALAEYQALQKQMQNSNYTLRSMVDLNIKRLSRAH
jgi:hypothetical protein